jgi:hypothetical protein
MSTDGLSPVGREAMERARAFEVRAGWPISFESGWRAARDYYESELVRHIGAEAEARERVLREALDNLAEAIERVDYKGEAGDVEDLDDARREAVAALAASPVQPEERPDASDGLDDEREGRGR